MNQGSDGPSDGRRSFASPRNTGVTSRPAKSGEIPALSRNGKAPGAHHRARAGDEPGRLPLVVGKSSEEGQPNRPRRSGDPGLSSSARLKEEADAEDLHARSPDLRPRPGQGRGCARRQARRRRPRDDDVQPAAAAVRLGLRALPHDEGQPLGARGRPDGQGHRAVARPTRRCPTSTAGSCGWASATSRPPRASSATT